MALTLNTNASSDVRAISLQNIIDLEQWIKTDNQNKSQNFVDQAAREYMLALIKGFKENKIEISQLNEARIPDGSPIGSYQPNTYFNNLCDF